MNSTQLETLISTLQQLIQRARNSGDSGEYYRLYEELRLAEADFKVRYTPALASV